MRGRPPLQTIILKHSGRTLSDDETVSSILSDVDSDDEDSDSEDNIGEEETEKLKLTLDVMPPIDPKFGIDFREKAEKMSTRELLSAYCLNAAGMRLGMELAEIEMDEYDKLLQANEDDEEMEDASKDFKGPTNQSLHIRKQATLLQKQMEKSFGHETLQLMDKEYERVQSYLVEGDKHSSSTGVVFGLVPDAELTQRSRKGRALKGGATMNIKRALQKNMNVVSQIHYYLLGLILLSHKFAASFRTGQIQPATPFFSYSSVTLVDAIHFLEPFYSFLHHCVSSSKLDP